MKAADGVSTERRVKAICILKVCPSVLPSIRASFRRSRRPPARPSARLPARWHTIRECMRDGRSVLLQGMPREMALGVLAHEFLHAYMFLKAYPSFTPQVDDGGRGLEAVAIGLL